MSSTYKLFHKKVQKAYIADYVKLSIDKRSAFQSLILLGIDTRLSC